MISTERVSIHDELDIVRARSICRQMAANIGFSLADQARLATAVSELTRNATQYALSGGDAVCQVTDASDDNEMRIEVLVEDYGPGISDINKAMQDGYTTSGGLGAGLPGTKRLVDNFHLESKPGLTQISIAIFRKR